MIPSLFLFKTKSFQKFDFVRHFFAYTDIFRNFAK